MFWAIVLDVIVAIIILFCIFRSARHGFARTVVEIAGFVAVALLTLPLSQALVEATYSNYIEPRITDAEESALKDGSENAAEKVWDSLPKFMVRVGEDFGLSKETFVEKAGKTVTESTSTALETATHDVIEVSVVRVLRIIFIVLIFLVLTVAVRLLARVVNKLFSFHLVGKVNRLLGGAIGVIKGVLFAMLFCCAVLLVASLLSKPFAFFDFDVIRQTYVAKALLNALPFNVL